MYCGVSEYLKLPVLVSRVRCDSSKCMFLRIYIQSSETAM